MQCDAQAPAATKGTIKADAPIVTELHDSARIPPEAGNGAGDVAACVKDKGTCCEGKGPTFKDDHGPGAVTNPDTDLILNMLDPENGPAAGLPYQVLYPMGPNPSNGNAVHSGGNRPWSQANRPSTQ